MLTRTFSKGLKQVKIISFASSPKFFSSDQPQRDTKQKEVFDSVVRSNTLAKTLMKNFTEGQDLLAYFPSYDPVRVLLFRGKFIL